MSPLRIGEQDASPLAAYLLQLLDWYVSSGHLVLERDAARTQHYLGTCDIIQPVEEGRIEHLQLIRGGQDQAVRIVGLNK